MKKNLILALAVLLCHSAVAQMRVTGTVIASDDGTPVSYATIAVRGSSNLVTTTDMDGRYTFSNVPGNAVLVISYIGYVTQEIAVNNRSVVDIILTPDALALEEVMVVAYGTTRRATFTGAATVVRQETIKDVPVTSFENALQGRVPGMQITSNSGQAGSAVHIRVRGVGSMNASNEPLYVIDGVPVIQGSIGQMGDVVYAGNNVMSTLNPSDIESITVLKDAAASALYGSRAANGVVVVQTKRGKEGKAQVSFRASVGLSPDFAYMGGFKPAGPMEQAIMNYERWWNMAKLNGSNSTDAQANAETLRHMNDRFNRHGYIFSAPDNTVKSLTITPITNITPWDLDPANPNRLGTMHPGQIPASGGVPAQIRADANGNPIFFDWEKELFRTAVYQTYDVAVSGGTDRARYYTSLSYTNDQGRSVLNDYNRVTGRLSLTHKVGKYLELETNVQIANIKQSGFNDTNNTQASISMQYLNLLFPWYWPTNFFDGEVFQWRYGSLAQNPRYLNPEWENWTKTLRLAASQRLTVRLTEDLSFSTLLSLDNSSARDHLYYSAIHYNGVANNGSVRENYTNYRTIVSTSTLNYNKAFGNNHNVSLLAGWEATENATDYMRASGTNLATASLQTVATAGAFTATAYDWGHNMLSLISRAEYNYAHRYFLSGSFRRDGSSRLSPSARWGNFWSVSGAWRLNNEAFMQSIPEISNLRLRASYGINGTLPNSNYGWRALTSYAATGRYMGQPGGGINNVPNANLSWETSYSSNIALELGLFNNRINAQVEYYNRDSKDLLQSVPISRVTGFTSTLQNIGQINNKGFEIELHGDIIRNNNLRWNVGLTAATLNSKVVKLYDEQDIIWNDPVEGNVRYIYREGQSTRAFYGLELAGYDMETGRFIWYLNNDTVTPDLMYEGRPATYTYTRASMVVIGDANYKVLGGLNSDLTWKGVSLGLNFIYRYGGHSYNYIARDNNDDGYFFERTQSQWAWDYRWTPENKNAKYAQRAGLAREDTRQISTRNLNDASFIRLKNITLAYNLPRPIVGKVGVSGARVYFNGSNLWTWAAHKEYDPEVGHLGIRGFEMPVNKIYTFGLEINF